MRLERWLEEDAGPVDEIPFRDVAERAVLVDVRLVPAQHPLHDRQQPQRRVTVAVVAEQVPDPVDPVQGPVGNRVPAVVLDLADDGHRQHPVRPRRGAEGDVVPGQPPVLVRDQVHHLVHHAVAHPGALLPRRAVGERVEGVQLGRPDAGPVQAIELRIAGGERGAADEGIVVLADGDAGDRDVAGIAVRRRRDEEEDAPKAVDIDGLVTVGVAAGGVAGARARSRLHRPGGRIVVGALLVPEVQPDAGGRLDVEFDVAGDDPAEVDSDDRRGRGVAADGVREGDSGGGSGCAQARDEPVRGVIGKILDLGGAGMRSLRRHGHRHDRLAAEHARSSRQHGPVRVHGRPRLGQTAVVTHLDDRGRGPSGVVEVEAGPGGVELARVQQFDRQAVERLAGVQAAPGG